MIYNPGILHESLQKEVYYYINFDFEWLNGPYQRILEMNCDSDSYKTLSLKEGDIISVKFYKPTHSAYCYLCSHNNRIENTESLISKDFLDLNSKLFIKIDQKVIDRDRTIDLIINF